MKRNNLLRMILAALFLALAYVMPFLTGQIPEIGSMLCPMHIPVLLCGFICGWPWGLVVGAVAPIMRSMLTGGFPPMYPTAMKEIQEGKKRSHWMWYIFPQLRGLGTSSMAHVYGISVLAEAKAYLEYPVLSERLYDLCGALLEHKDKSAVEIFGDIDEMKLKSSMTLFALTDENYTIFD